jgi:hypothetical protein
MRGIFLIILCTVWVFSSCMNKNNNSISSYTEEGSDVDLQNEISQAKDVFRHLYLPIEMSGIFKGIDVDYNPTFLKNPSIVDQIIFSNEIALSMGIFGVDLGYVQMHEQWNTVNRYFHALEQLSSNIGISPDLFIELSKYFDHPVYSKDSLEYLANKIYLKVDYNLRKNGRERASALVILGGWLEAINIATKMYASKPVDPAKAIEIICEQQASLNSVLSLLMSMEQDELIANYIKELTEMQNILRGLNAAFRQPSMNENEKCCNNEIDAYVGKINIIIKRIFHFVK